MKADPACESDTGIDAVSERMPRRTWSTPAFKRLRAGLAETGPNINFDGVEGTS